MSDAAASNISPHLVELSFSEDVERLTGDFVGREWVFEQIDHWVRDSDETFFILTGEAGVGKSAIAARLTQIRDDLAAHHFCIAGRNSTIVPGTVLRSIAAQLGRQLPDYGLALANTLKLTYLSVNVKIDVGAMNGGQITGVVINNLTITDPKQEIESLLTAPLSAMPAPAQPVLILLDSLDEAFTYNPDENLVTLLAGLHNLPRWARIILTSRPEGRVLSYFASVPTHIVAAESQMNREDLRRYVATRVGKPGLSVRLQAAPQPIAAEALVERVAGDGDDPGLAAGNFLYTKILLDDIASGVQPLDDLAALPKSLDEIYQGFLLRLAPQWETRYQPLLAVLAVAREPLTREQLLRYGDQSARLIGGRMSATLVNLALGVLVQFLDGRGASSSERYSLFHQSLRDYLGATSRSGRFACPPADGHGAIADTYWQAAFDPAAGRQDWSNCDTYGLAHLPAHLDAAGSQERLHTLRFDYDWLQTKLDRLGINALLADFSLGQKAADDTTRRLGRALEQGAYVLAQDPAQLAAQLLGRLLDDEAGPLQALLTQAHMQCRRPCLLPRTASLREAGALLGTLAGHRGEVYGVAVTPDGSRAISASSDGTLSVWDLASGQELRTLTGHADTVYGVAVTPDGSRAVSASSDQTLKVWDLARGAELLTLSGHTSSVHDVAVTPDGTCAVSASDDHTLKVWDLVSGAMLHTLAGHWESVNGVAVTPDGSRAVSASDDYTLKVWDLMSGVALHTLTGHRGEVYGVAVTPDGSRAVSASWDKTLKVWDLARGVALHTLTGHTAHVNGVAVTPDGSRALSASNDGTLKVWDLARGVALHTLTGHVSYVNGVAVTPDGRRVISASWDGTLKVWDISAMLNVGLARGLEPHTLTGHAGGVNGVVVTPDGSRAISASYDGTLKVWDLARGVALHILRGHTDWVRAVTVTPDGSRAVSASYDKTLKVWDLARGVELHTLAGHTRTVNSVAVTPDGSRAVSASYDKTLKVWDLARGVELHTLAGHTDSVRGVAVTPDGRRAVSASGDTTLKVWDLASGQALHTLAGHTFVVSGVAATPDGGRAVSASWDKTLKVWDLESGVALRTLTGHASVVIGVAVTPDGSRAISISRDHTLKVWDLARGVALHTLTGHTDRVTGVAVTPNGDRAVSASRDHTFKVWDLASGACLATIHADGTLLACAVTPDGRTVVVGGASGRVHFLRLEG